MTLPRTVSGVQFPVDNYEIGPARNASGDHYTAFLDSGDDGQLMMWKADNGDNAWAEQDAGNGPNHTHLPSVGVWLDGDILHCTYQSTSGGCYYSPFQMSNHASPDVWGSQDTIQAGSTDTLVYAAQVRVRSDGDIVVVHQSPPERLKGSDYTRISFAVNEGTDFGDATGAVDDGGTVSYSGVRLVLGESDNVYIFYKDDSDNLWYKILDNTNSLSSAQQVSDTAIATRSYVAIPGVYYDASGTETVMIGWLKSSDSKIAVSTITEGGTPGAEVTGISDNTVEAAGAIVAALVIETGTPTVYLLYADDTNQDLSLDGDVIGGGETDTSVESSITANDVSPGVYTIDNGDTVIGYVYDDGGTIKYNEYVIISGGAATITLDTLTLVSSIPDLAVVPGAVSTLLDTLTLAGSIEDLTVTVLTSVALDELTLAGSIEDLAVVPGAVSTLLDTLTLAGSIEDLAVIPGAVSTPLDTLTLAGSIEDLAVVPGAISILLDTLTLAGSLEDLAVIPGAISVLLDTLTLAGSIEDLTVLVSTAVVLDALTLAGSIEDLAVIPGAISILLDTLTLVGSIEDLTVVPGAVSTLLDTLTLAGSIEDLTVVIGATAVALDTLTLVGSLEDMTVIPGAVSTLLDTLTMAGSIEDLAVIPGGVSLSLDSLTLASTIEDLTVNAVVSVLLDELTLAGSLENLAVVPGVVSILLDTLTLVNSLEDLAVVIGATAIALDSLTLTGSLPDLSVIPGEAAISLDELSLAGSLEDLAVVPGGVSLPLDSLTLASSIEDLTVYAPLSVVLDSLNLSSNLEDMTVVPGATSVVLVSLILAATVPDLTPLVMAKLVAALANALAYKAALSNEAIVSASLENNVPE